MGDSGSILDFVPKIEKVVAFLIFQEIAFLGFFVTNSDHSLTILSFTKAISKNTSIH